MSGLSIGATIAWQIAAEEAAEAGHPLVEREHVVIGICSLDKARQPGALAEPLDAPKMALLTREAELVATVLGDCHLDPAAVRRALRQRLGRRAGGGRGGTVHRSAACKASFERAFELARTRGEGEAETGVLHLLAAILATPGEHLTSALQRLGARPERLRLRVDAEIGSTVLVSGREPPDTGIVSTPRAGPRSAPVYPSEPGQEPPPRPTDPSPRPAEPPLERARLGRDLVAEARAGRLRPVVGRREETLLLIRTLRRQARTSPLLVGEPGVGKTAIVEGLAQRIADGKEGTLGASHIVALSDADLGAERKGEVATALARLVAEASADQSIVLFVDDLHLLLDAADDEEDGPAGRVLVQALARGDVVGIGATTPDGYRERIEHHPTLARRFQPIVVREPTPDETRQLLDEIQPHVAAHHGVSIEPGALDAAVELTVRALPNRRLPEKAIDALDQACARVQVPALSQLAVEGGTQLAPGRVTRAEVAAVVAERTGSPAVALVGAAVAPGPAVEQVLRERILGQDEAIGRVAGRIRRAQAGLTDPRRPLGVLLFAGPAGVGKTALATALAEVLFGSVDRLVRLDLSEYEDEPAVLRLIGRDGDLTGPLLHQPASVVLLDAVDRAHRRAVRLLGQAFETGRLADAGGRAVDVRQALFILTTTLPASADQPPTLGAELADAVDEVIPFAPLGPEQLAELTRRRLDALHARLLRERRIVVDATDEAVALLARLGTEREAGARGVDRVLGRLVEEPLSGLIMSGRLAEYGHAVVRVEDGQVRVVIDLATM